MVGEERRAFLVPSDVGVHDEAMRWGREPAVYNGV